MAAIPPLTHLSHLLDAAEAAAETLASQPFPVSPAAIGNFRARLQTIDAYLIHAPITEQP